MQNTENFVQMFGSNNRNLGESYFLSVSETCHLLGLGWTTIFSLLRDRHLEKVKWHRRTLITRKSVEKFAANLTAPQTGGGHGSTAA